MKIGLDLRFLDKNLYSDFVIDLVKQLVDSTPEITYNIYSN